MGSSLICGELPKLPSSDQGGKIVLMRVGGAGGTVVLAILLHDPLSSQHELFWRIASNGH